MNVFSSMRTLKAVESSLNCFHIVYLFFFLGHTNRRNYRNNKFVLFRANIFKYLLMSLRLLICWSIFQYKEIDQQIGYDHFKYEWCIIVTKGLSDYFFLLCNFCKLWCLIEHFYVQFCAKIAGNNFLSNVKSGM